MNRVVMSALIGSLVCAGMSSSAWAQYKVVGPDGRVTYTDRPPADRPVQTIRPAASSASTNTDLPFALRNVVSRYPVTLYTSSNCSVCDAARTLLKTRGVPFSEKTVMTSEDASLFKAREGTDRVPFLRIGSKQIPGFEATEWSAYLDMAGYPKQSMLPPGYRHAAPTPMAPVMSSGNSSTGERTPGTSQTNESGATSPAGNAPAGFRF